MIIFHAVTMVSLQHLLCHRGIIYVIIKIIIISIVKKKIADNNIKNVYY